MASWAGGAGRHYADIAAVLLDVNMPVLDGFACWTS